MARVVPSAAIPSATVVSPAIDVFNVSGVPQLLAYLLVNVPAVANLSAGFGIDLLD